MIFFGVRFSLLFVCWLATLGADRLDALGGEGPLRLMPFYLLTPPLVLAAWWPLLRGGRRPALPVAAHQQSALILATLALLALSVAQSQDVTMSAGRLALLVATVSGVSLVYWGARSRDDFPALLVRGAQWGLAFNLACNVLMVLALLGAVPDTLALGSATLSLEPTLYGSIPRLSGATLDMNRGAMLALVFGSIIALGPPTRWRSAWVMLAAALVLGSLSRSALLAAVPIVLLSPVKLVGRRALAAGLVVVALIAGLLLDSGIREQSSRTLAPLAERFSPSEVSAQTHASLFERGVDLGTRSVEQAFLGIGYGSSFRVLADIFDGDPYGNLHSGWLALWVEAGILAMLLVLALTLLPLRHRTRMAGVLIGLAVFNGFYVGFPDPTYWLALGLAWGEVPT